MSLASGRLGLHGGAQSALRTHCVRALGNAKGRRFHSPDMARLGVATSVVSSKDPDFGGVVNAVERFHEIHQHFVIPAGFRAPKLLESEKDVVNESAGSTWPTELEGFPLGFKLKALLTNPKHRAANEPTIEALRSMGFPIDVDWRAFLWEHLTLQALEVYKKMNGHLLVPRAFVVPPGNSRWPRPTWGLRLGLKVMNIRQQRYDLSASEVTDLHRIEFVWDVHDFVWTSRVLPALQTFKMVYGHCNVEQAFIVPCDAPWPPETWFMTLGHVVAGLRSSMSTYKPQVNRDRDILAKLGFTWDVSDDKWMRVILPALEAYARVHGARRRVDVSFVIPEQAPWPKETWGLRLGNCIHGIRYLASYRHQVLRDAERLREIGWLHPLTEEWRIVEYKRKESKTRAMHVAGAEPQISSGPEQDRRLQK